MNSPAAITDIAMIVPYTIPAIVSGLPVTNGLSRSFVLAGMLAEPTSDRVREFASNVRG